MHPRKSSNNLSRRVICGLLALITVCSLCFLPGMTAEAHAAQTVAIPDPADYFGDVDDTDKGETYTAYYFEGYPTFPKSKVDKYVSALKKAGLSAGSKDSTGTIINMKYDKEEKLQIVWHSDSKRDGGYLRVNVVQPLTISTSASTTVTKPAETTKSVSISNPADYFGSVDKTVKLSSRTCYYFDGYSSYPSSEVTSYIKALKDDGLTGGTVKDSGSDKRAALKYQNKEKLWIVWDKSMNQVCVNVSNDLSVAKASGTTKPAKTDPSIVEMINDIFGKSSEIKEYDDSTRYFYYVSSYPSSKMTKFAKELKELGIKEVVKYEHSDGGKCIEYHWKDEVLAKVWLYAKKNKNDEFSIAVYWAVLKESGKFDTSDIPDEPTPPTPTGGSGSSACMNCSGGACRNCGGKGYTRERLAGKPGQYTTKTCTTCYGTKKCRTCGGSGWVD